MTTMAKAYSTKIAGEKVNFDTTVNFIGATDKDIKSLAMETLVIRMQRIQRTMSKADALTMYNGKTIIWSDAGKKAPVDVEAEFIKRLKAMTPEERAAKFAEMEMEMDNTDNVDGSEADQNELEGWDTDTDTE